MAHTWAMQSHLLSALRAQHQQIRSRWTALLHVEPVSTPLANPNALVHLLDWTLEEIYRGLGTLAARRRASRTDIPDAKPHCPCGRNPLLAYFAAGQQAMQEALILVQSALPSLDPISRDAALVELNLVLHQIAHREVEAFCGVCQHRLDHFTAPHPASTNASVAFVTAVSA